MSDPGRSDWYALELCRKTSLGSGTVVQILFRLEQWGWLEARWEKAADAHQIGRPRRRFYKLTGAGAGGARQLLRERFSGSLSWSRA
jgi:PadR family transcriptional regulator, regulatory protein PadR